VNSRNAHRALKAGLCLCAAGLLVSGAVEGQEPAQLVPPPPVPFSGQHMPPPPAPPASHALPTAPAANAGSPFLPAAATSAPTGRPRLLRRQQHAANPPEKGLLRDRLRGLFRGGNPRP
jgi:hypothetical protein